MPLTCRFLPGWLRNYRQEQLGAEMHEEQDAHGQGGQDEDLTFFHPRNRLAQPDPENIREVARDKMFL